MNASNSTTAALLNTHLVNDLESFAQPQSTPFPGAFWLPVITPNGTVQWLPQFIVPQGSELAAGTNHSPLIFVVENVGEPAHPFSATEFLILLLGIMLNLSVMLTIMCTGLIRSIANKYICTMLLADAIYLICAFADLCHARTISFGACTTIEWFSSTAIYVSGACVVLLTAERFLAIVCPLEHMQFVDFNRWLIILLASLPFMLWQTIILYATNRDNSVMIYNAMVFKCSTERMVPFTGFAIMASNIFHYLMPLTAVTLLNAVIAFKVHFSEDTNFLTGSRPKQQQPQQQVELKKLSRREIPPFNGNGRNGAGNGNGQNRRGSQVAPIPARINAANSGKKRVAADAASLARTASIPIVLFLIPVAYVLLNTPFYTSRFIAQAMQEIDGIVFSVPKWIDWVVYYMFMANFASNAVVYALASSSFRRIIGRILRRQFKSVGMGSSSLVAVSSNSNSSSRYRFSSNTSSSASGSQRGGKDGSGYGSRPRE